MPVAVPLVAAPALILLGLSAGADLGVLFVAGCLAVAVGALADAAAVAGAPTRHVADRAPRGGSALIAAAAVVACVLLVVDAVFAI